MGEGTWRWLLSTALPCFSMPGFRAAAVKKQSNSKRGFLPNSIFPNTELTWGKGSGSVKSSHAVSVLETFDAFEKCELLEHYRGERRHTAIQGVINPTTIARARFVLGLALTVPGTSRVARKYEPLFSQGKVRFFSMMWAPAALKIITCVCLTLWN